MCPTCWNERQKPCSLNFWTSCSPNQAAQYSLPSPSWSGKSSSLRSSDRQPAPLKSTFPFISPVLSPVDLFSPNLRANWQSWAFHPQMIPLCSYLTCNCHLIHSQRFTHRQRFTHFHHQHCLFSKGSPFWRPSAPSVPPVSPFAISHSSGNSRQTWWSGGRPFLSTSCSLPPCFWGLALSKSVSVTGTSEIHSLGSCWQSSSKLLGHLAWSSQTCSSESLSSYCCA